MKIAILGAGGVRTPLIVAAMAQRQARLGLTELALMDIDAERLAIIGMLTAPLEESGQVGFKITRTTDSRAALAGADFVITTFRVGGIASRVIDERVPLKHGVVGQETTGPGGFAMAMRTIPVLLDYLRLMKELCPNAWLINFANPAGLLAEAALRVGGWARTVGICDAPITMQRVIASVLQASADEVSLDYFGLNHLGWVRAVWYNARDHLPDLLARVRAAGKLPGLPFSAELVIALGMIPNEYLYYYYYTRQAVEHIRNAGLTRSESIAAWNTELFAALGRLYVAGDREGMQQTYRSYLEHRGETYMVGETGNGHVWAGLDLDPDLVKRVISAGYAGVAMELIESLCGAIPRQMILNVPNRGAIHGMADDDVVEVPALVGRGVVRPLALGLIPFGSLGLMQQVKAYERLTIAAATEGSYGSAVEALTLHPLVRDYGTAVAILNDYRTAHGAFFPELR